MDPRTLSGGMAEIRIRRCVHSVDELVRYRRNRHRFRDLDVDGRKRANAVRLEHVHEKRRSSDGDAVGWISTRVVLYCDDMVSNTNLGFKAFAFDDGDVAINREGVEDVDAGAGQRPA